MKCRPGRQRFSRACLSDETEYLARKDVQVDAIEGNHRDVFVCEMKLQIAYRQQRLPKIGVRAGPAHSSPPNLPFRKSPASANANTARPRVTPGKNDTHHCPVIIYLAPFAIIPPHSGVGGWTPAPTKVRP